MLTVIFPVYNQAHTLERSAKELLEFLEKEKLEHELLIMEDGSTDGSDRIGKDLEKRYRNVRFFHCPRKLGRGRALKKSAGLIKGDMVVYMDTDLATELGALRDVISLLGAYDVVIGSRYHPKSKAKRTFKRLLLSRGFNLLVKLILPGLNFTDYQCGFKGFRKKVFVEIGDKCRETGWSWDLEFIALAKKQGYSIKEIPVRWKEQENTTVGMFGDSVKHFAGLLRIRARV